jgi:hypothetical protein
VRKIDVAVGLAGVMLFTMMGLFFYGVFEGVRQKEQRIANLKTTLQSEAYTILNAEFNSPKITVICKSQTEFLQKANELNIRIVYQVGYDSFYIVDQEIQFGYKYTP